MITLWNWCLPHYSDVALPWWRLKSTTTQLFVQQPPTTNETSRLTSPWWGEPPVIDEKSSNAGSNSMSWRHHEIFLILYQCEINQSLLASKVSKRSMLSHSKTHNFQQNAHRNKNDKRSMVSFVCLSHLGRVTYICVSKLTIIGSDNGLSPGRCQSIIWTVAGLSLNGPLRTNSSEMLFEIDKCSFRKMHLNMSSGKWRPLGL